MSSEVAVAAESGGAEEQNVQQEAAQEALQAPRPGRSIVREGEQQQQSSDAQLTVEQRVRQDPEFAWEQVKVRDQKIADLGGEVSAFRELKPFIDAAGDADTLLGYAALGQRVQDNPALRELVQQAINTGQIPTQQQAASEGDQDDDLWDEDVKKVRKEFRSEMAEMRNMLQEALSGLSATNVRTRAPDVRSNMDAALTRFEAVPEAHEEALALIESKVAQAQRLAESGNKQQQDLVEQMAGPDGQRIINYMLFEAGLHDKYGAQIFGAQQTPNPEETAQNGVPTPLRGDARSVNPSRPSMPPLPPLEKGQVARNPTGTAMAIYNEVRRRRGRGPA